MVSEARLVDADGGLVPEGEGWFVVNARQAQWIHADALGSAVRFEGSGSRFAEYGVNIHILAPGEPNGMYHGEGAQEDFLVLSGECLLLIEEQERRLRAWDFVHCPPWVEHIFVGAGDGPCVILMIGGRPPDVGIRYPESPLAQRHDAGVTKETTDPREAYARFAGWQPGAYRDGDLP
jgi:uncharacterized cupin superfamily protein